MTKYIRAFMEQGTAGADAAEVGPIRFVASTEQMARDGLVIEAAGWRLENYNRNPVFLWGHDYRSLPIGRATAKVEGNQLVAEVEFDQEDEFARQVESKYRRGYLNAVSVGWNPLDVQPGASRKDPPHVTEAELLDISAVSVPSDPGAMMDGRGMEEDEPESGRDWEMAAIGMMRLYHPAAGRLSDTERRRAYNRLAAQYRRQGKVAPEYLKAEELEGLGLAELRGLFLEDEPDLTPGWWAEERAGAVLNARNRDDLAQAVSLIQGVLERALKESAANADEPQRTQPDPAADETKLRAALEQIRNQMYQFE